MLWQDLADKDKLLPYDPFAKAMGLLGGVGWELVSVQDGKVAISQSGESARFAERWETLSWRNKVAYFKRRVVAGRAVDEPKLVL